MLPLSLSLDGPLFDFTSKEMDVNIEKHLKNWPKYQMFAVGTTMILDQKNTDTNSKKGKQLVKHSMADLVSNIQSCMSFSITLLLLYLIPVQLK